MKNQPLFITGYPRSGTTLLWNMLLQHSRYKIRSERAMERIAELLVSKPGGIETSIFSYLHERRNIQPCEVFYDCGSYPYWSEFLGSNDRCVSSFLRRTGLTWRYRNTFYKAYRSLKYKTRMSLESHEKFRLALWIISGNRLLARSFIHYAKKAQGSTEVLEKTPRHCLHMDRIKWTFPQAKLLFMIRHPFDVFASHKQLSALEYKWSSIEVQNFCQGYGGFWGKYEDAKKNFGHDIRMVRYEELCRDAHRALKDICTFCGVELEAECLLTDSGRGALHTRPARVIDRKWRQLVSVAELRVIQEELGSVMDELGYERHAGLLDDIKGAVRL